TGAFQGLQGDLVQLGGGPAEHRLALLVEIAALAQVDGVGALAGGPPGHRSDALLLVGRDHGGARPVSEDHTRGAVVPVDPVAEFLRAHDQDMAGAAHTYRVRGQVQGVAEARTGCVDVAGTGGGDAEPGGHGSGGVGDLVLGGAGGHDHQVDVLGGEAAGGQGLAAGGHRHAFHTVVGARHAPLLDAHTAADPLVIGVHALGQVVV